MDMNPKLSTIEESTLSKLLPLQGKQLLNDTLGIVEIKRITRKDDLSGVWVYFSYKFSSEFGNVRMDGEEFLSETKEITEGI